MPAPKFDARSKKVILEVIRRGQTSAVACRLAEINPGTLWKWLKHEGEDYVAFQMEYKRAEAEAEEVLVNLVMMHAQKDWRSAKWILERRFPHWNEAGATTQEMRDRLDEMKLRKAQIELEFAELPLEVARNADGDIDIMAVLNEASLQVEEDAPKTLRIGKGRKDRGKRARHNITAYYDVKEKPSEG